MPWERDTESEKLHPCLPANQKVFFNGEWKNIEAVNIGDKNRYGVVSDITEHYAEKLVEIECDGNKTISTWNHPFLIKRDTNILWVNADQITTDDFILSLMSIYDLKGLSWKNHTKQHQRDILGTKPTKLENLGLSIALFGKTIMGKFLTGCKYTIKTLTKQTTTFQICNLSVPLNTNGCTQVVDLTMENGKSHVMYVENINFAQTNTGIFQEDVLQEKSVKNVISKNHSQQERFLLQKVGSVKIIKKQTKVYNLTIDGIPAFDTEIGVSHNTQKPVKLLEKLIKIFTDEGEVVIDPCAGSASTLIAAHRTGRASYGFEIKKNFFTDATKRPLTKLFNDIKGVPSLARGRLSDDTIIVKVF